MAVDEPGNRIYVRPAETQQARAARAAQAAAQQTDAAAVAAKPNAARYARNPSDSNRQEFVTAYSPVYRHVMYELELLVDSGLDVNTATDQIKQRHPHDPLMDQVVSIAGEQVATESAATRQTNEVMHQGRPGFEAAMQARDQAIQQKAAMTSTPWKGSADAFDRQLTSLDNTISQSTTVIDSYIGNVSEALGEEVDGEAHNIAAQRGVAAPSVEDYSVARANVSQQHQDPLLDALLDTVVSQQPGYIAAVESLDATLKTQAQQIANDRRDQQAMLPPEQQPPGVLQVIGGSPSSPPKFSEPATITREDYVQAGKKLAVQLPHSQPLINSRIEFLVGQQELKEIHAAEDPSSLPSTSDYLAAARALSIPDNNLDAIRKLAKDDPVAYWALQQAARHGVVFDPYNLQLAQWFTEGRTAQVNGENVNQYRIGTDAQGNARWASEQELRNLAIRAPDKFALFALGMQGRTTLGVSGEQATKSIMSLQVLLRYDDVNTRATDKFSLGEAAWARGDHDAARGLWNEALSTIATNQRQATTQDEARMLGEISSGLFTHAWMSRTTDELPMARGASKIEVWGSFINDLTRNGAAPPQFANVALDVYRTKFDRSWIKEGSMGETPGDQWFKALSRLSEVTDRAPEIATLLTDKVYAPIFRYMNRTEYSGMQAAVADPEGVSPEGAASLARAYLNDPRAFPTSDPHMQREVGEQLDVIVGRIGKAEELAPSVMGQQNAQQLMKVQLTDFDGNADKALHGYFDHYIDPARRPEHFTVEASQTVDIGNQLVNYLGWGLGLHPTSDFSLLDGNDTSEVWYKGNQLRVLQKLLAAIREHVGDSAHVEIQATPYVYVDHEHKQYVESSLFVVTVNGKQTIFNEQGATFDSWDAYFNGNEFSDKGRLYLLKQNQPQILQASGSQYDIQGFGTLFESRRANVRTDFEGFKDGFKDVTSIDFDDAVSGVAAVAGIVAIPLTGGASLALTAVAVGSAMYMVAVAINDLATLQRNGHDLGDLSNDQVRSNWETLGITALMLALPGLKLLRLKTPQSGIRLGGEASESISRARIGVATVANLGVNVDQLHVMLKHWDDMSTGERWKNSIFAVAGFAGDPAAHVLQRHVIKRDTARASAPAQDPGQLVGLMLGPDGDVIEAPDGAPVLLVLDTNGIPVTDDRGRVLQWTHQPDGQVVQTVFDPQSVDHFSRPHSPVRNKPGTVPVDATPVDDGRQDNETGPQVRHLPPVRKHTGEHVVAPAPVPAAPLPNIHLVHAPSGDLSNDAVQPEQRRVRNDPNRRRGKPRPGANQNGRPGNRSDGSRPNYQAPRPDVRGNGATSAGSIRGPDPDSGVLATVGTRPSTQTGAAAAPVSNVVHIKLAGAAPVTAQADFTSSLAVNAGADEPRIVNSAQPPDANKPPDESDGTQSSNGDGAQNTSHHASPDGAATQPNATGGTGGNVPPPSGPGKNAAGAIPDPGDAAAITPPEAPDVNAAAPVEGTSSKESWKKSVLPFLPYGVPALIVVPYMLLFADSKVGGALSQFVGRVRGVQARGPGYSMVETAELVALRNAIEGDLADAKATIQALERWRVLTGMSKKNIAKLPNVIEQLENIALASQKLAETATLHGVEIDSVLKISHKSEEITAAVEGTPDEVRQAAQQLADAVAAYKRYEMGRGNEASTFAGRMSKHSALTLLALGTAVAYANPFDLPKYLWIPDFASGLIGTARQILQMENGRRLDRLRDSGKTDPDTLKRIEHHKKMRMVWLQVAEALTAVSVLRGGYSTFVYFGVIGSTNLPPPLDKVTGVFQGLNALAHAVWVSSQFGTDLFTKKPEDAFAASPANIGRMRTLRNTALSLYVVSTVGGFATALAVASRGKDKDNNDNNETPPPSPEPTNTLVPTPTPSVTPTPTTPPPTIPQPQTPPVPPTQNDSATVTVRVGEQRLRTLWAIATTHQHRLLTESQKMDPKLTADERSALSLDRLYQLNKQFDPALEGGGLSTEGSARGRDPDLVYEQEQIVIGETPVTRRSRVN